MLLLLGDPTEKSGTTVGGFSMGIVGVESCTLDGHGVALGFGVVTGVGIVTGVGTVAGVEAFVRGCAVAEGGAFAGGGAVAGGGGAGCGVAAGGDTVITGALSGNPFVSQLSTNPVTNQRISIWGNVT